MAVLVLWPTKITLRPHYRDISISMFHLTLCLEHALWPALRALADVI